MLAAVLPVEAQMIASAPLPFAHDTASVMPRSLKLPVGFMPSNLRWVSMPIRSDRRGAWISGVEPSISDTIGMSALERQPVAVALDQGHAVRPP